MNPDYNAFTIASKNGLLRTLNTDCGISVAFAPGPFDESLIKSYTALWDTGATSTVITKKVATDLGLKPIGKTQVSHADGKSTVNVYAVNVYLPNSVAFSLVKVTEGILSGFDVLIGMDIISQGDFAISNYNGKTKFSFRMPSVADVDFVADYNSKVPIVAEHKIGRNAPCTCGSRKKYKHCCGKKAS